MERVILTMALSARSSSSSSPSSCSSFTEVNTRMPANLGWFVLCMTVMCKYEP